MADSATKIQLVIHILNGALYDKSKPWDKPFGRLEALTGIPRFKLLMCIVLLTSVMFVFAASAEVMSNAIALVYPAMATISMAVSPPSEWRKYDRSTTATEARNEKFTYWLKSAAVLIVESVCWAVLRFLPLYQMSRTWFFIWCFAPIRNNSSAHIYTYVKLASPALADRLLTNCKQL